MQETVRKITNGSGLKVIGLFYSHKMHTQIPFESVPEKQYFYWLEFDRTVKAYFSQPITIEYRMDDKFHRYTPDVELRYHDDDARPEYVDVKPKGVAEFRDFKRKAAFLEDAFDELGTDFKVVTAESIEQKPRLQNLQLLYYYADLHVPQDARAICKEALSSSQTMPLKSLAEKLASSGYSLPTVYALMFQGTLGFDLNVPINGEALLSLP